MEFHLRLSLGDASLYFDVEGAALWPDGATMRRRPTLVLLHGGPGFDHSYFKPTFSALSNTMQLVFLDQRGNGRSDRCDPSSWNLATWASDLSRFLRALDIERPIILGNSFGGLVAQYFAALYPEELSGLILYSTSATCPFDDAVLRFERLGGVSAGQAASDFFQTPSAEGLLGRFSELCFPYYSREGWDSTISSRAIQNPDVLTHFFAGEFKTLDLRPLLDRVTVPTLILAGTEDPICPPYKATEMRESMRAGISKLKIFPGGRHILHLDYPTEFFALIREFIRDAASAPSRRP
jgi:pimeloyl-ACP methyl ester carboxylesterase